MCEHCADKIYQAVRGDVLSPAFYAECCPMCGEPFVEPEALTRDDLMTRDGKPVYCVASAGKECDGWCIVDISKGKIYDKDGCYWLVKFLGEDFNCYDREPS